jgi:hypothetical protein
VVALAAPTRRTVRFVERPVLGLARHPLEFRIDRRKENRAMWAQLIKTRLKPGREEELERLYQQLRATEQPGSGLVRSTAMRN